MENRYKKILLLTQTEPKKDMMFNAWLAHGLNAAIIFKPMNKIMRLIRRFWTNYHIIGFDFWLGDWKRTIFYYDTVIVHASERTKRIASYIHQVKPSMRIIYWYWNPVNKYTLPKLIKDKNVEHWSFDIDDCEKYGMKYNVQYYYDTNNMSTDIIEYDIYFIGHDKGRMAALKEIKSAYEHMGLIVRYDIVSEGEDIIPYHEVQKRIKKAKAILEINQYGQSGVTLRAMEALFFSKKLITNNQNIIYEDYYNKNNIFIIGRDNISDLKNFLDVPYSMEAEKFKVKHTIESWMNNFLA